MTENVNKMDIAEFRSGGYLQEVNRRILHPLGLALSVVREEDGSESLDGVWDYRDDPEGIVFVDADLAPHADAFENEWMTRLNGRVAGLGFMVQPVATPSTPQEQP